MQEYKICKRCIMDTTDPEIVFDENGYCNHCSKAIKLLNTPPVSLNAEEKIKSLQALVEKIKSEGKNKKYDCIIGVSGGVDSTFAAYFVKKNGLNPLAVHLDNGWNSRIAVTNIEKTLKTLNIDLYTHVIDWEEFKDLQLSFLKASTPDSEVPSDHAITALLYKVAAQHGVKYILAGTNITSESILPKAWSQGHSDWKYIHSLQKQFGTARLKTFPHYGILRLFYYIVIRKIKYISILNYTDYAKEEAKKLLISELGWEDYGGKHHESVYTHFYQSYLLPKKFGFDKRRAHLSSLIMAGQITREEALEEMKKPAISDDMARTEEEYIINKFGLTRESYDRIMNTPPKSFHDYPSYFNSFYYKFFFKIYKALGALGVKKSDI
ncbi:MAG TPA: N-acetyl sugar amidotransferase [Bacteroidales bacterium]|nr:N-acetyl sugar amidotransferase [Bacteroidales bacterium]HOH83320.1 N-acetyl sugar amidotransferase [Bacteroidales bacterium]HPI29846.1 N-acetyl sugar amidotransferase [Bacteroidales bacterium]